MSFKQYSTASLCLRHQKVVSQHAKTLPRSRKGPTFYAVYASCQWAKVFVKLGRRQDIMPNADSCVGRKAKTPRHLAVLSMLCVSCAPKVENLHQSTSLGNSKDSLQWRKANQNPRLSAMLSSLSALSTHQTCLDHQRQVPQQQRL